MEDRKSSSYVIIPARLKSTRLPHKLLRRETGKTLLQHTYEAARRAARPKGVLIAADCQAIADEVAEFGGDVVLTNPEAPSGTDRVAEAAVALDADVIVNLQGDEPEVEGEAIDECVRLLDENPGAVMSTLATPIRNLETLFDPACVKVVFDERGAAMYFSRSPIPFVRDGNWPDAIAQNPTPFHLHIGIYAYRRDFLIRLTQAPPSPIERLESLEQLRVLSAGHRIQVGIVNEAAVGIDTPEDYEAFVRRCHHRRAA